MSEGIKSNTLFNEVYAASRVPAGFRPGHPFGVYAGVAVQL